MRKKCGIGIITALLFLSIAVSCTDYGLEPTTSGISGRIQFKGVWPPSTESVRLIVFKQKPAILDVFTIQQNLAAYSDTLPRFVNFYDYMLPLDPGSYEWVVLVWRPNKPCPIEFSGVKPCGMDTLGMYAEPNNPRVSRAVEISHNRLLTGIDIVADFAVLEPPSPIFP